MVKLDHCICVCKILSTLNANFLQIIDALIACMQNMQANKITITTSRMSQMLMCKNCCCYRLCVFQTELQ